MALGGCSFQDRAGAPPPMAHEAPAPARMAEASAHVQGRSAGSGAAPAAPVPGQQQPSGLAAMAAARKLIRTGQMTLTVDSYPKAADEVKRIAEAHGGYLADA